MKKQIKNSSKNDYDYTMKLKSIGIPYVIAQAKTMKFLKLLKNFRKNAHII